VPRAGYRAGIALLLVTTLLYASGFVLIKQATASVDPLVFVALRFTIASAALFGLAALSNRLVATGAVWRVSIAAGICFGAGFLFQTHALVRIDVGRVGFLTGLYVIFPPLIAYALTRKPLTRRTVISLGLAVLGLALLSYTPGNDLGSDALALVGAFSFACHFMVVERIPAGSDWRLTALIQCLTVAALANLMLVLTDLPIQVESAGGWGGVLFAGLVTTALTLPLQVIAQRHVPPGQTAMIFALEAPLAALFGVVLLQESLGLTAIVGCALIFTAMMISTAAPIPPREDDRQRDQAAIVPEPDHTAAIR
jgi:drug/metabolite transporter (DMT)-like permease